MKRSLTLRLTTAWSLLFVVPLPLHWVKLEAQQRGGAPAAVQTAEIARHALPATVTILVLGEAGDTLSLGSGFFVRSDGVLVTNWHVVANAYSAVVLRPNGERFTRVTALDGDSTADIALLKVPGYGLPTLEPRAELPDVGERIVAIGSPLGLSQTVSEGIVSAKRLIDGRELVQMTAAISPGSSGGAVLDGGGRVFAIATAYRAGGQQLNFAVPVRYALGMLGAASSEHPLHEFFGRSAAATAGPASQAGAIGGQARPELASQTGTGVWARAPQMPPRAIMPRDSLDGTWRVEQFWSGDGKRNGTKDVGFIVARRRVGLLILAPVYSDGSLAPTQIFGIDTWRTAARGDVTMSAGDVTYTGYQTRTGLALQAELASDSTKYGLLVLAEPMRFEATDNSGLYTARVQTTYRASESAPPSAQEVMWSGDIAVGFAHGIMYLDLFLTNDQGGEAALFGRASFGDDGSFHIESKDGLTSLDGRLVSGKLRARWIDRRAAGARFEGMLAADRW